jgi:hypothetical protein
MDQRRPYLVDSRPRCRCLSLTHACAYPQMPCPGYRGSLGSESMRAQFPHCAFDVGCDGRSCYPYSARGYTTDRKHNHQNLKLSTSFVPNSFCRRPPTTLGQHSPAGFPKHRITPWEQRRQHHHRRHPGATLPETHGAAVEASLDTNPSSALSRAALTVTQRTAEVPTALTD